MSDKMGPISFEKLLAWILSEFKTKDSIFGIHKNKIYHTCPENVIPFLGEKLGVPIGPAAGPNSQMTQNIVSAYLTGSRFIELKTVQIIDGDDLPVSKPCIKAEDECYNVEWSTELRVNEAYDEYVKAWILLHVLMKELNLSDEKDFIFNISVGYDLEGIKSEKINSFIENMKDASESEIWKESLEILIKNLDKFSNFKVEDLKNISPNVCNSITLSTLHGCPPDEIERIANYLLKDKHLHTFIKMNPTLLGEAFVRDTFSKMGYDYITLNPHHFKNDLQYDDGVKMLKRIKKVGKNNNLEIGVKLSNTLPVKILNNELPGEEMYMSGRALYPLTINLARKLSKEFNGELNISYSGGADFFNVDKLFDTGICPITFATTILKPGGYERINQIAKKLEPLIKNKKYLIDTELLSGAAGDAISDEHHIKSSRIVGSRKINSELQTYDCSIAPCSVGCPINQQIPEYMELVGKEKYDEAFQVIVRDNASPAITSTICNHNCQNKCTRLDYESSLQIRDMKKIAVDHSQDLYVKNIKPTEIKSKRKVVIIGAGAAGLSTALYLRRNGMEVEVLEIRQEPYGIINYAIPEFRIPMERIKKDFELVKSHGVKVKFGANKKVDLEAMKDRFDYIVLAIGANKHDELVLKKGSDKTYNAIEFLEDFKKNRSDMNLGTHVCVIGGGDVAMDAARAAKRVSLVNSVSIIYRRTVNFMPASAEEIKLALEEGIHFKELMAPVEFKDKILLCEEMILGERDSTGRRKPVSTGEVRKIPASSVITAVGERVDSKFFENLGIEVDQRGLPKVNSECETSVPNVYVAGDAKNGPGTIVEALSHGKIIAVDILRKENMKCDLNPMEELSWMKDTNTFYERKGILMEPIHSKYEAIRCLKCNTICELCVDVCPNRANVIIEVEDSILNKHQVIHVDGMCNECGNCGVFCPYKGNPYKDKLTIFWSEKDLNSSNNSGFYVEDLTEGRCIVRNEDGMIFIYNLYSKDKSYNKKEISKEMKAIIEVCLKDYRYLLGGI